MHPGPGKKISVRISERHEILTGITAVPAPLENGLFPLFTMTETCSEPPFFPGSRVIFKGYIRFQAKTGSLSGF